MFSAHRRQHSGTVRGDDELRVGKGGPEAGNDGLLPSGMQVQFDLVDEENTGRLKRVWSSRIGLHEPARKIEE